MNPIALLATLFGIFAAGSTGVAFAAPFTGPTSPYYLDNHQNSMIYIVQGTTVIGSFPTTSYGGNSNQSQGSLAVGSTVTTHGFFTPSSGVQAGEYTLAGTPTGTSYDSFPLTTGYVQEASYDGTTDGVHNYYVQYYAQESTSDIVGNVVQTDLYWQNPVVLFSVQSNADQCCEFLSIAYDSTDDALWVGGWQSNEIREYSFSGTLITSFATHNANGALAYDRADDTLWLSYGQSNLLEQYSTSGVLLQSGVPIGLPDCCYLAGEFPLAASVPEPATGGLLVLALTAAGFARRRMRFGARNR